MDIEKAIEILDLYIKTRLDPNYHERIEATKLGIEALKRMKLDRAVGLQNPDHLLHGETERR